MAAYRSRPISGDLLKIKEKIEGYVRDYGLVFYDVIFEVCDYDTINILAAQEGFPNRYPHWRFGMQYDQMSKGHRYGIQKIYEMVVNTNPCYAYLLNSNHMVDQKTVMAHVYGHADFFRNNHWFSHTNRKMMDVMANHGTKIRRYMDRYGQDKVELFIDKVSSLDNMLDSALLFETSEVKRTRDELDRAAKKEKIGDDIEGTSEALKSFLRSQRRPLRNSKDKGEEDLKVKEAPISYRRDIMHFLMEFAPLEDWQADVLGILREEAYYFLPQRMTKIMNEGWASYWHSTVMTQKALRPSEVVDFSDHHAAIMAMGPKSINPYKIGIELFRDIEHRWDTGKFGKHYNDCSDMNEKENWNMNTGQGREKIFEVRKSHNDVTFIDEFFTEDFCNRMQVFTYRYNARTGRHEIDSREFQTIKNRLLSSLTNFGTPCIEVESHNYKNRSELLLKHVHFGQDLDLAMANEALKNIFSLWKRPVHLETTVDGSGRSLTFGA